jgi:hypothetical protein
VEPECAAVVALLKAEFMLAAPEPERHLVFAGRRAREVIVHGRQSRARTVRVTSPRLIPGVGV